jgi:antitoxin MazE
MLCRITKLGNRLIVGIPKELAEEAGLRSGSSVDLRIEDGVLSVIPLRRGYLLEQLVSGITHENRHDEIDTGRSVGHEVW